MRRGGWMTGTVLLCCGLMLLGGCVTLEQYRDLQAKNRLLVAEKTHLDQELYDCRQVGDSLRTRIGSLEREVAGQRDLVANLKSENELLDEMRLKTREELEAMASNMTLGDIAITGHKLPAPLDNALKRFADQHPSSVMYDPVAGTVKWNSDLLFASGSDVVRDSSKEALREFCDVIKSPAAADFEVIVVGHTDTQPIKKSAAKHPTNWHLSAHRAISVSGVLRQFGYSPERIGVMGYGEYRPVADNSTAEGSAKNRRVEIYLIPTGSIVRRADAGSAGGDTLAFARLTR